MARKPTYEELEQRVKALEKDKKKQIGNSLEESENLFQEYFNRSAAGISAHLITDKGPERAVHVNDALLNMLGYTREEFLGLSLFEILEQEERDRAPMRIHTLKEKGKSVFELNFIAKDGQKIPSVCHLSLLDMAEQSLAVASVADISTRRQAEKSLQDSEKRFRDFINSATDSFVFFDTELNIIGVNNSHMNMFHPGMDKNDLIGKNLLDIVPDLKETGRFDDFMKVIETGIPSCADDIVPHKIFGNRSLSVKVFKMINGLGSITTDITERKKAENMLRESEEKHRLFFENAAIGIIHYSSKGIITAVNSSMVATFGSSRDKLIGLNIDAVPDKDFSKEVYKSLKGEPGYYEGEYRSHTGGKVAYVKANWFPILRDGKVISCVGIVEDITKSKRAEKEKMQAQIYAAEQEKHALVGQIAGKMAHDFNNVLGAILGNAELSLLDCEDADIRETLELIVGQTLRGRNLTKNLVAFAGDNEPKHEFFRINEKIDLVINLLKRDLDGIEMIREDKHGVPELLADPGMIEHMLVNLLQNSSHALSMTEEPIIIIRTYNSKDGNIFFEIEDNGCGIPKEYLKDIYEPSFTLKGDRAVAGSYKNDIKGTGYGMSNVKKYIEQHKGKISVESEFGSGTKFSISLPVIKKELTNEEKIKISETNFQFEKYILLVEDEFAISDVQYRILTQEPCRHRVDIAQNGQVAMDLFDRNEYDFISLDYSLPGNINGVDVYNHIRKTDREVTVLFISANIEFLESTIEMKQNDTNIDHLSKPCQNREYVSKVNELLTISSHNRDLYNSENEQVLNK